MRPSFLLLAFLTSVTLQAQTFTDVSGSLPSLPSSSLGVAVVDVDGDGRTDLLYGVGLLRQTDTGFDLIPIDEDGAFGALVADYDDEDKRREVVVLGTQRARAARYHVAEQSFTPIVGSGIETPLFQLIQGSVLLDDDRDGQIDVLLGNDGPPDVLLRNNGDGTFANVSASVLPGAEGGTYGMAAADFDNDGDSDVAIGLCLPLPAFNLFYRRGATAFAEVAASVGAADPLASWGLAWLDYDGDGWLDLFVANMPETWDGTPFPGTNTLYRNNGNGTFTDVATAAGVAGGSDVSSWTAAAADFDNDGWIDLLVANLPEPSRLFHNNGNGTFTDVTPGSGLADFSSILLGVGDVNGDGWVDIVSAGSQPELFLNDGGANGWLTVRLRGTTSNPEGIGAHVEVTAGGQTQLREITAGDGFMSQSHGLMAHVGLGTAQAADVTVRWPSGQVDVLTAVAANQEITVVEGLGANEPPAAFALLSPADGAAAASSATLTWEAATDPEGDPTTYTVHLSGPNGDETFTTTATSRTVVLDAIGEYAWAVVAEDDYTPRTSLDAFTFTNNTVSVEDDRPAEGTVTMRLGPNPSSGSATLTYTLPVPQSMQLEVIDALGRRVWTEALGQRPAGTHQRTLDLYRLSEGVYLLRLVNEHGEAVSQPLTRVR